ncbi:MAG: hypothetical protein ACO1OB_28795 [Archangium sp.]
MAFAAGNNFRAAASASAVITRFFASSAAQLSGIGSECTASINTSVSISGSGSSR